MGRLFGYQAAYSPVTSVLPACFAHTWDHPAKSEFSQTDAANTELAIITARTAATLTTVVLPDLELGLSLRLGDKGLFSHYAILS